MHAAAEHRSIGWAVALAVAAALAGCAAAPLGGPGGQLRVINEGEQIIQPGMTTSDVAQRLGQPFYRFGVRLDDATIWNYRMRYGSCAIYQVTILPSGIVKEAGEAPDPACDRPSHRRW